jgi:hypothetical protein
VAKRVKGVEVCARDELGSTEAVKKGIEKSLKHRQSVIVDCVNMHPKDRIMWATYARQQCPTCRLARVFVDTPVEEARETFRLLSFLFSASASSVPRPARIIRR